MDRYEALKAGFARMGRVDHHPQGDDPDPLQAGHDRQRRRAIRPLRPSRSPRSSRAACAFSCSRRCCGGSATPVRDFIERRLMLVTSALRGGARWRVRGAALSMSGMRSDRRALSPALSWRRAPPCSARRCCRNIGAGSPPASCASCSAGRGPWRSSISFVATMAGSRPALPWVALLLAAVFAVERGARLLSCRGRAALVRRPLAPAPRSRGGATTAGGVEAQILHQQPVLCDEVRGRCGGFRWPAGTCSPRWRWRRLLPRRLSAPARDRCGAPSSAADGMSERAAPSLARRPRARRGDRADAARRPRRRIRRDPDLSTASSTCSDAAAPRGRDPPDGRGRNSATSPGSRRCCASGGCGRPCCSRCGPSPATRSAPRRRSSASAPRWPARSRSRRSSTSITGPGRTARRRRSGAAARRSSRSATTRSRTARPRSRTAPRRRPATS